MARRDTMVPGRMRDGKDVDINTHHPGTRSGHSSWDLEGLFTVLYLSPAQCWPWQRSACEGLAAVGYCNLPYLVEHGGMVGSSLPS
jgi:hypothetical protein